MIRNLLLSLSFLFSITACFSQTTFQKVFRRPSVINYNNASGANQTKDGGYIILGVAEASSGAVEMLLVKTDSKGDTSWVKNFGNAEDIYGYSVRQTNDGGYILAGNTYSTTLTSDIYLIKTDSTGTLQWSKTYGGSDDEDAYAVRQTSDSGYIIVGDTWSSFAAGGNDMYVVKTNASGTIQWAKSFGGPDFELANAVIQTADSGYLIAGYAGDFGAGNGDIYVVKTKANGDTLWTKTYGGTDTELAYDVQQTSEGGYIFGGYTLSFGASYYDAFLLKTDVTGAPTWSKIYGGTDYESARAVEQTTDGGYVFSGTTGSFGPGISNMYAVKTNSTGDTSWTKNFGGSRKEGNSTIHQTKDGGYILAGYTNSFNTDSAELYFIKTDGNGASGCNEGRTTTVVKNVTMTVGKPLTVVSSAGSSKVAVTTAGFGVEETTLCLKVGINELNRKPPLMIYPNPSSSIITVDVSALINTKAITVSIFNFTGETIKIQKDFYQNTFSMDIAAFAKGIYLVKVSNGSNELVSKFVRE